MRSIDRVAIIGGGPASSTLGQFLVEEGFDVRVYFQSGDDSITIGESLVPGVVPILRDLQVEDHVESFSRIKPGAGFTLDSATELNFPFENIPGTVEDYAYNVPRNQFNETLRSGAEDRGVEYVEKRVDVTVEDGDVKLDHQSGLQGQPDFVVDATGRARLLASTMDLPVKRGPRTDIALFTHFDDLPGCGDGTVYTDLLEYGWCWRIPLPDRVSFGVVMDAGYLEQRGETPEQQLRNLRENNSRVRSLTDGAERIEPVFSYSNYQLVTQRLQGSNWALVGDAGGFVDPVFATGLFLGMDGARRLASALSKETSEALEDYETQMLERFDIWMQVIERFYDGRLMTLLKTGQEIKDSWLGKLLNPHMEKHMGRIFTGRAAESSYGLWLLKFMCEYGLKGNDKERYCIKSTEDQSAGVVPN